MLGDAVGFWLCWAAKPQAVGGGSGGVWVVLGAGMGYDDGGDGF